MKNIAINVHITPVSKNAKTGPIPVTTSGAQTCPTICPFNTSAKGGCYAAGGPLAMHWRKVTSGERGGSVAELCDAVSRMPAGQVWRHNQAGDLMGNGESIDRTALVQLVKANNNRQGFTYTHYDVQDDVQNRAAVEYANFAGFTVNLSGNDVAHADALHALNIGPVVVVVDSDTTENFTSPAGNKVVICPATVRDDVTCSSCKMCARQRDTIIAFPAHGSSKKKACAIAAG